MSGAEILLVNPRRKRRSAKRSGRRPMTALQRQYFGKRRARVTAVAKNPRPARRHRRRAARVRRYNRNPTMPGSVRNYARRARTAGTSFVKGTLLPSFAGAAGALGLDVALAVLPVPASMKAGPLGVVTRVAGAIGIGYLGKKFMGAKFGENMMAGALTVTIYDQLKQAMTTYVPSIPLSADSLGWTSPGVQIGQVGSYLNGLGTYVSDDSGAMVDPGSYDSSDMAAMYGMTDQSDSAY